MSNIVMYSTPTLNNDTNFINNFLDTILENYCNKNFQENTSYPNIEPITLPLLIKDAYPNYYIKSPGLLGHNHNTNVLKIYEENLHQILCNALEHKVSRLFVNVLNVSPKLCFADNNYLHQSKRVQLMSLNSIESVLQTRALHKLKPHHLYELIFKNDNKISLCTTSSQSFQVYKPNLDSVKALSEEIKKQNEEIIHKLNFFNVGSAYKSLHVMRIAFSFEKYVIQDLKSLFTDEFYKRMEDMSKVIVNHVYKSVDKIKDEIIQQERDVKRRRDEMIQHYKNKKDESDNSQKYEFQCEEVLTLDIDVLKMQIDKLKQKAQDVKVEDIKFTVVKPERNLPFMSKAHKEFYIVVGTLVSIPTGIFLLTKLFTG